MKFGLMCPACRSISGFPEMREENAKDGKYYNLNSFNCTGCKRFIPLPPFLVCFKEPETYTEAPTDIGTDQRPELHMDHSGDAVTYVSFDGNEMKPAGKPPRQDLVKMTSADLEKSKFMPTKVEYDFCTGDDKCACPNCYDKNGYRS